MGLQRVAGAQRRVGTQAPILQYTERSGREDIQMLYGAAVFGARR